MTGDGILQEDYHHHGGLQGPLGEPGHVAQGDIGQVMDNSGKENIIYDISVPGQPDLSIGDVQGGGDEELQQHQGGVHDDHRQDQTRELVDLIMEKDIVRKYFLGKCRVVNYHINIMEEYRS